MTSSTQYTDVYVWVWLPYETGPVVAGQLTLNESSYVFNYGKSYLARDNAISLYDKELPLQSGVIPLLKGLIIPGCIRDAAPDVWGRRVIINTLTGQKGQAINVDQFDELTYMLESGSDRIGALDFQLSATEYCPRIATNATLDELLQSAERVEKGIALTPELDQAIQYGSAIGGARPKALIDDEDKKYIAKFPLTNDTYSVVKVEFIAMRLAQLAGLDVAPVTLTQAMGKDVLLTERFDRIRVENGWQRKGMVSALTLLELDEQMAPYASYEDLSDIIRRQFTNSSATLRELFSRIVFNILCGNNDDHARNHAAFWDGEMLTLTPAYDICPQARTGNIASQAMLIIGQDRMSRLSTCVAAAHKFMLSNEEAIKIIQGQIATIKDNWTTVCDDADLSAVDRNYFGGKQFLNPFVFETMEDIFL